MTINVRSLVTQLRAACSHGGKPIRRQLMEAFRLRVGEHRIGLSEYFEYGIWHAAVTPSLRDEFIGWRDSSALDRRLNTNGSRVLANDKLLNYLVLQALGYPIPQPVATYSTSGRFIGGERRLRTIDDVEAFLAEDVYPFYVKPISAGYGRDVLGVAAYQGDRLLLLDGSTITRADFLTPFHRLPYGGMLFQRPLHAHPAVVALTGTDAISCIRFICLVTPAGPAIHTAFWKITTGRNMVDNFSHGDFGNCLGAIDLDTGTVVRAIARTGPGGLVEHHPTTGKAMTGFVLPDWSRAKELVLSASAHFPGLRLQNWDVALCPDGPVLVELNTESELGVPQAISGRGLMDMRLRQLVADIASGDERHRLAVRTA